MSQTLFFARNSFANPSPYSVDLYERLNAHPQMTPAELVEAYAQAVSTIYKRPVAPIDVFSPDLYTRLGVTPQSTKEEIKRAYLSIISEHRFVLTENITMRDVLIALDHALKTLSDPQQRKNYDDSRRVLLKEAFDVLINPNKKLAYDSSRKAFGAEQKFNPHFDVSNILYEEALIAKITQEQGYLELDEKEVELLRVLLKRVKLNRITFRVETLVAMEKALQLNCDYPEVGYRRFDTPERKELSLSTFMSRNSKIKELSNEQIHALIEIHRQDNHEKVKTAAQRLLERFQLGHLVQKADSGKEIKFEYLHDHENGPIFSTPPQPKTLSSFEQSLPHDPLRSNEELNLLKRVLKAKGALTLEEEEINLLKKINLRSATKRLRYTAELSQAISNALRIHADFPEIQYKRFDSAFQKTRNLNLLKSHQLTNEQMRVLAQVFRTEPDIEVKETIKKFFIETNMAHVIAPAAETNLTHSQFESIHERLMSNFDVQMPKKQIDAIEMTSKCEQMLSTGPTTLRSPHHHYDEEYIEVQEYELEDVGSKTGT